MVQKIKTIPFLEGKKSEFLNVSSNISSDQFKSPKRNDNHKICPKMTFEWPLCDLKESRSHFFIKWMVLLDSGGKTPIGKEVFIIILVFWEIS